MYGDHVDLHVLTHSFPTRRSSDLWLITLCLVGLVGLLQLPVLAQAIALGSLALVAAYPFMKRITWWPQVWLGLVFSWGALVGWPAVTGLFSGTALVLWAGSVFWVIGYDTIYALQDRADDGLVGVKSTQRNLGKHIRAGLAFFYSLKISLWGYEFWPLRSQWLVLLPPIPMALPPLLPDIRRA